MAMFDQTDATNILKAILNNTAYLHHGDRHESAARYECSHRHVKHDRTERWHRIHDWRFQYYLEHRIVCCEFKF